MQPPKYDVIYADPPWSYRGRKQFGFAGDVGVDSGGSIKQYPTMKINEIAALAVQNITADNALLFMWIPGPLLPDGLFIGKCWGFEYKRDAFVWNKLVTNPGYYTLSQIETCYVFKRGNIPQPRGTRNERQYLETHELTNLLTIEQYIKQRRGRHSAKPAEVRDRITCMFPTQEKIELFARERVEGWDAWGNEV